MEYDFWIACEKVAWENMLRFLIRPIFSEIINLINLKSDQNGLWVVREGAMVFLSDPTNSVSVRRGSGSQKTD